jgi:hypothetical protein
MIIYPLSKDQERTFRFVLMMTLMISLISISPSWSQHQAFNDPRIQQAIKDLESEPSIQEVHRAALKFYNAEPETVASLRTRANLKYLLPDVNVRYRRSNNGVFINKLDYLQGEPTQGYAIGKDQSEGDVSELQISGTWSLSRLLFNPEVLDVSSLAALQEGVLKEVTRLYYTRRRLQIDMILNPPKDAATQLSKEIRIDRITATLDALTNNIFSKHNASTKRVTRGGAW